MQSDGKCASSSGRPRERQGSGSRPRARPGGVRRCRRRPATGSSGAAATGAVCGRRPRRERRRGGRRPEPATGAAGRSPPVQTAAGDGQLRGVRDRDGRDRDGPRQTAVTGAATGLQAAGTESRDGLQRPERSSLRQAAVAERKEGRRRHCRPETAAARRQAGEARSCYVRERARLCCDTMLGMSNLLSQGPKAITCTHV